MPWLHQRKPPFTALQTLLSRAALSAMLLPRERGRASGLKAACLSPLGPRGLSNAPHASAPLGSRQVLIPHEAVP